MKGTNLEAENTTFGAMSSTSTLPFFTSIPPDHATHPFLYADKLMLWGSCFSNTISNKLIIDQFQVAISPYGIVYNPLVMARQIERLVEGKQFEAEELVPYADLYHSPWHHGDYSHPDRDKALAHINDAFDQGRRSLAQSKILVLTWGHTQLFLDKERQLVVANCHKRPASAFEEYYAGLQELIEVYDHLIHCLRQFNPSLQIITTVSPVRYLRNGFVANTRSKATLHLLADYLKKKGVAYFPSYELLNDELRDYRFYADDLIHPSNAAVQVIYDRFLNSWFDPAEADLLTDIRKITASRAHRPLHPDTPGYQKHLMAIRERIDLLKKQWPAYNFLFNEPER
ncbi:MAG: GSCFA domain-containing protein [Saprospiraceae bacterium]|nr:GSCFA domain-containing protein [Saprospiraceae bacterium]